MALRIVILAVAMFAAASMPGGAQDSEAGSLMDELRELVQGDTAEPAAETTEDAGDGTSEDVLFPDLPENFEPDEETLAAIQTAVQRYYDYRSEAFLHRQRVFQWQHQSSIVIFCVVVAIVMIGLYFSWLQFRAAIEEGRSEITTLEASHQGFKISSPVLGVIILTLSLAFFYLYLVHVYPIVDSI